MRRGLWLGTLWFAAAVAIASFAYWLSRGGDVGSALWMSAMLFAGLFLFPLGCVFTHAPRGASVEPPDHGPWSAIEFAVMTFAFLLGALVVIIGVVLKDPVWIAGGLGVFLALGVGTAALLRKIRLGRKRHANTAGISWEKG
ncbi:MAG: hypothetical protein V3T86_14970 [Planctomycetota bacterium]